MFARFTVPVLTLLSLASCEGNSLPPTQRDIAGNYATTSDYKSMMRTDFLAAMRAGLDDFDSEVLALQRRATELGGDSLQEFADCSEGLREARTQFANQLEKVESAMNEDWPDRREEAVEQYDELRSMLDEAYDEVLES